MDPSSASLLLKLLKAIEFPLNLTPIVTRNHSTERDIEGSRLVFDGFRSEDHVSESESQTCSLLSISSAESDAESADLAIKQQYNVFPTIADHSLSPNRHKI
jgi:hypothetical protein